MRRLAIINQKGGVGKTTTAANLSAALARFGRRVLMIDLDPQAHLSLHFGVALRDDEPGVYTVLADNQPIREAVRQVGERLTLLPAQIDLAGAEVELSGVVGREVILGEALSAVEGDYDFVVLDCPPSLNVLTLNGLTASNEVVVPLQPHFLALQGLGKLFETVSLVAQRINPEVRVTGVVICMHEQGTRLAGEVVDDLQSFLDSARGTSQPWSEARLFSTIVRRNIRLAECPSHGMSIFDYAPQCNGADDYMALAREVAGVASIDVEPDESGDVVYVTPGPEDAAVMTVEEATADAMDNASPDDETVSNRLERPIDDGHATPPPTIRPTPADACAMASSRRVELELGGGWMPAFEALPEERRLIAPPRPSASVAHGAAVSNELSDRDAGDDGLVGERTTAMEPDATPAHEPAPHDAFVSASHPY